MRARGGRPYRLLHEPLVHFAAIGVVLFAVAGLRGEAEPRPEEIVLASGDIANLAALFERTWRRPPTEAELDGLVEARIREEVLYREALAMGLESDDPVIRRRLVQKLEFLTDDLAARRDPTDADLQAWLDANPAAYAQAPKVAFRQVFFSPDRRGEALAADAEAALAALAAGTPPEDVGDPIPLPGAMPATPLPQIEASFGTEIPASLADAEPGAWFGPVRSPFGAHLLFGDDRGAGGAPSLDQVRAAVERDWRDAERREARQALYEALRAKYAVTVDDEAVAAAAATQTADAGQ